MSELKVKGKIVNILQVEKGTSKAGKEWQKQSFVIDTGAKYNPEICFQMFGDDKISMLNKYKEGQEVEVFFNVSSREYNGKYFHNLDGWKINSSEQSGSIGNELNNSDTENDDLPF